MTLASAARAYSERLAWAVLPLRGKVPAIPKGRATSTQRRTRRRSAAGGVSILTPMSASPVSAATSSCSTSTHGTAATVRLPNSKSAMASFHTPYARSPAAVASTSCSTPSVVCRPARSARASTSSGAATSSPPRVSIPTPAGTTPGCRVTPIADAGMARRAAFTPSTAACRAPTSGYRRRERWLGPCPAYSRAALLSAYENIAGAEAAAETLKKCLPRAFVGLSGCAHGRLIDAHLGASWTELKGAAPSQQSAEPRR